MALLRNCNAIIAMLTFTTMVMVTFKCCASIAISRHTGGNKMSCPLCKINAANAHFYKPLSDFWYQMYMWEREEKESLQAKVRELRHNGGKTDEEVNTMLVDMAIANGEGA